MRRVDLLEMLVEQGRELERVRAELANAREQLADRRIVIEGCGSIAEAALELGEVFEAAQRAADLYVENVRRVANASREEASRANDQLSVTSEHSATKTQDVRAQGACVQDERAQSECAQSTRVQGERAQSTRARGERVAQPAQAERPVQAAQLAQFASPSSSARATHSGRSHAASNPVDPAVLVQSAKASQGVYARNRAVAGRNNPRHAARSVR